MATSSKEKILTKIRKALTAPTSQPFPNAGTDGNVYQSSDADLSVLFAETFTKLQGQFSFGFGDAELVQQVSSLAAAKNWTKIFCSDEKLRQVFEQNGWTLPWYNNLADCNASITSCECLVARTGTMVLSSVASSGRTPSVYAPAHICVAYTHQLVYNIKDGLELIKHKYGKNIPTAISFASGPSRTADIEKTLVTGVHGPKEVFCFLIEQ